MEVVKIWAEAKRRNCNKTRLTLDDKNIDGIIIYYYTISF